MVYVNNGRDHYRFADYVWVFLNLDAPEPFIDGQVYVTGAFSDWQINQNYVLNYNSNDLQYQGAMLLKQGYYNYMYSFKDFYGGAATSKKIEGSHFETENDYIVIVYHKPFGSRHERIVGYTVVNSQYR